MKTWQFEALDSCFFRGAKPFNQNESGYLPSQFPPSVQTMAGVIRAAIGEAKGVDWQAFHNGNQPDIAKLIGANSDDAGALQFVGPYVQKDGKRLYPVPLHILYSSGEDAWSYLQPSEKAIQTNMGEKRLPEVAEPLEGAKPLEDAWIDADNLQTVLRGGDPSFCYKAEDLISKESRVGIERKNKERKVKEGALYFTEHIRLKEGVRLAMDADGVDDIQPASMLRLGGEGRMAHVEVLDAVDARLKVHEATKKTAMIVLLTHGDFGGKTKPKLGGIEIISACVGKAVREGGWDYKERKPKPLKSLVPAGSVYFVRGDIGKLGTHIGERTTFGYGEIAIGTWEDKS